MKKYLNKNIFYQGDSNIFESLCVCYILAFLCLSDIVNRWFKYSLYELLYGDRSMDLVLGYRGIVFFVFFIILIYIISVGTFKKKKWSTLLTGPFTKKDIRRRELAIIIISALVFIFMYLLLIAKGYVKNIDIINYTDNILLKVVLLDLIRLISIASISIGGLLFLDSIFSNIYALFVGAIFVFIYNLALTINKITVNSTGKPLLNEYMYGNMVLQNKILLVSSIFIVVGLILIIISSFLTNKIKVENMSGALMFNLPKKIFKIMLYTFLGLVMNPIIKRILDISNNTTTTLLSAVVFILSTLLSIIIIKKLEKKNKMKILI